jgi:hypothetical protein
MRKVLAALVASVALGAPAAPARAAQYDFRGECGFDTLHEPLLSGDTWTGEVEVAVYAASVVPGPTRPLYVPEPAVAVTDVWCEMLVNGVSRGNVLTAPDGTGFTAAVAPFSYEALDTDVVDLCTHATVDGTPLVRCWQPTYWPPEAWPPEFYYVFDVLVAVVDAVGPVECEPLRALAPLNDAAPDVLHVDPETGDVDLLGEPFWDCPPYGEGR